VLVIAACLLALLAPLLAGRSLRPLLSIRLAGLPLVWVALLAQVVALELTLPAWAAATVHVASYVLAAAFLWLNRGLRGLPVLALGAACNAVTIALNGGTLPASADAGRASPPRTSSSTPRFSRTRCCPGSATSSPGRSRCRWRTCSAWATSSSCWALA
jgi:hypothetical protein